MIDSHRKHMDACVAQGGGRGCVYKEICSHDQKKIKKYSGDGYFHISSGLLDAVEANKKIG